MASIPITSVLLNLVSDPTVVIELGPDLNMDVASDEDDSVIETEEITASGSIRSITEPGNPRRVGISASQVGLATRELLAAHKGHLFCYRDWDCRLLFGTYAALRVGASKGGLAPVSLTFSQRTHSIEV